MKKDSSELVLLDVNVLLALAWPNHVFHRKASARMENVGAWATCAATELGFLRISLNPNAVEAKIHTGEAIELLKQMVSDPQHRYLEAMPSPTRAHAAFRHVLGHNQLQDAYLVWFAAHHRANLLTLDTRLQSHAHVEVLA